MHRIGIAMALLLAIGALTPSPFATPLEKNPAQRARAAETIPQPTASQRVLDLLRHVWLKTGGSLDPGGVTPPTGTTSIIGVRGSGAGVEAGLTPHLPGTI